MSPNIQALIDERIAVVITSRRLSRKENIHITNRMDDGRLDDDDVQFVLNWQNTSDSYPVVAPYGQGWKFQLPKGGWMVGFHDRLKTVLGHDLSREREMKPNQEDVNLNEWLMSMVDPAAFLQKKFPRHAMNMAVAALDGQNMDDRFDDVDPHPGSLDLEDPSSQKTQRL